MSQVMSEEIRNWISEKVRDGVPAEQVYGLLTDVGWDHGVAMGFLLQSAPLFLGSNEVLKPNMVSSSPFPVVPVPNIDTKNKKNTVEIEGHVVEIIMTMKLPRVIVFGNLFSKDECEKLIEESRPKIQRSTTVKEDGGGEVVHPDRTSSGTFFNRGENEFISMLEQRMASLVGWPVENGEGIQVLNYQPGAEYKPHQDYFDPNLKGSAQHLKRGGQRVGTIVVYLNDCPQGGGTIFPDVDLEVAPRQGMGVFFSYDTPHVSTKTLHGGSPVVDGEKWIITKWMRENAFE